MVVISIAILAVIDLVLIVLVMCYCCKYEKRLDLLSIDLEAQSKFNLDMNKSISEIRIELARETSTTIHDSGGNSQEITLDELAEYVLNDEPIIRKADKVIWGKDENKSNI